MASKEVATKDEKVPAPAGLLDDLAQYGEENREVMTRDDMSIPFLTILQSLSPQVTKGQPEFIKGANVSDVFNTVTRELFPTQDDNDKPIVGLRVVSLAYKSSYIEWVTRANGGGFVNEYDVATGEEIMKHTQKNDNKHDIIQQGAPYGACPGNQLSFTHTHFVAVIKEDGSFEPAILSCASTQLKPSRDWNALIDRFRLPDGRRAPRFFGVWSVTTEGRSNDSGSWYVWRFEKDSDIVTLLGDKAAEFVGFAKEFIEGVKTGAVEADHSKSAEGTVSENPSVAGEGAGAGGGEEDGEIPF